MSSEDDVGIAQGFGSKSPSAALWRESHVRLTSHLRTLPDKPDETVDATLAALWHLADGRRVSARAAPELALSPLDSHARRRLRRLVDSRLAGVPLAYLTGRQSFMGLEMVADRGALIPRRETETLGQTAIDLLQGLPHDRGPIVVDACTGVGNLAAVIATSRDDVEVWATDISAAALNVARRNLAGLGLLERVVLRQGDLLEAVGKELHGHVDLIVCNPPYLSEARRSSMSAEIVDHEPKEAFDGGPFGLRIVQRLVQQAPAYLRPGGWLAFEVGAGQGPSVATWVRRLGGFAEVATVPDDDGTIRVLVGRTRGDVA